RARASHEQARQECEHDEGEQSGEHEADDRSHLRAEERREHRADAQAGEQASPAAHEARLRRRRARRCRGLRRHRAGRCRRGRGLARGGRRGCAALLAEVSSAAEALGGIRVGAGERQAGDCDHEGENVFHRQAVTATLACASLAITPFISAWSNARRISVCTLPCCASASVNAVIAVSSAASKIATTSYWPSVQY